VAKFEQFALNSLISPAGIVPGQALDQYNNSVSDGRTTNAVLVCPPLGH
jgi:hypothetical protein